MWYRRRRRLRQLALVMVAAPAAAWALEQAARRAEAHDQTRPPRPADGYAKAPTWSSASAADP